MRQLFLALILIAVPVAADHSRHAEIIGVYGVHVPTRQALQSFTHDLMPTSGAHEAVAFGQFLQLSTQVPFGHWNPKLPQLLQSMPHFCMPGQNTCPIAPLRHSRRRREAIHSGR